MVNDLPQIGDVVESESFAFGHKDLELGSRIYVDGTTTSRVVNYPIDEAARDIAIAMTGDIPPRVVSLDMGTYDPERAKAHYVVEEAAPEPNGPNWRGDFRNVWRVVARRLSNGVYDPDGELIVFDMMYEQTGGFAGLIHPSKLRIVRKMKKIFV